MICQILGVSSASHWPALSASKQVGKRISKQASKMPLCLAKAGVNEVSAAEEESLKIVSREYPWAAKMDQSLRNLHRVTKPEYMEDGTPLVNIPSHVLLEGLENQKEFIVGQFFRCVAPPGGLVHAVVNRIWGRNCRIFSRKVADSSYLFHIPNESTPADCSRSFKLQVILCTGVELSPFVSWL
ncbi:hypothetical protein F2Q68_00045942 [Brassica cretica]|uniref:DUF4283 domain-containing protein n=1 Tax=Brassica cretica TaxID=69181 RepID=A0A8S9LRK5_BRACR|nr:hypothetical protein F2Q68_00045942 [Brassica cretica]